LFNKQQKLAELGIHQRKLSELISRLLEKADNIDQETQQRQAKLTPQWHENFATTCKEIVSLSEAVNGINSLIKDGQVGATEKAILRSTNIAKYLWQKLQEIQATAEK